jgi:hypothetical protein
MIMTQLRELSSSDVIDGWRCLLCGENLDPVIEGNRMGHCPPVPTRARVPGAPTARYIKGKLRHEHR